MQTILFVEDKDSMAQMLRETLETEGYRIIVAADGQKGIRCIRDSHLDLVLSDLKLPKKDGIEVLKAAKAENPLMPVIMMTAFGTVETAVAAMKEGAADFITKPFDTDILLAKLRAILARRDFQSGTKDIYEIGKFIFNARLRTLTIGDDEKKLSPKEAQLLELLALNPNALISREVALKKIWGNDDYFTARSMDVYITKLRKFLSEDPRLNIKNIHGSGFQLIISE